MQNPRLLLILFQKFSISMQRYDANANTGQCHQRSSVSLVANGDVFGKILAGTDIRQAKQ